MDLSDLGRHGIATPDGRVALKAAPDAARLQTLLAQVGAEIASPLTSALERLNTLLGTGRIERQSLNELQDEVEAARRAGMICQQLTRFAAGRVRQSHEAVQLADMVGQVLVHRRRETHARGVDIRSTLPSMDVVIDPSQLFGLLNSTLDWSLANTVTSIDISVDARPAPLAARLVWRFPLAGASGIGDAAPAPPVPAGRFNPLDSLTWRLIEQTAWAMGLQLERRFHGDQCVLTFDFPRPVQTGRGTSGASDANQGFAASLNSQPLAGSHLLVIASRREMRVRIRDALSRMNLILDFVNSVEEAVAFCRDGLPHAIVIEAIQSGERFARFRRDICADLPDFVFIEIVEEGREFQMSGPGGVPARIGREVMAESLPAAVVFELSKAM